MRHGHTLDGLLMRQRAHVERAENVTWRRAAGSGGAIWRRAILGEGDGACMGFCVVYPGLRVRWYRYDFLFLTAQDMTTAKRQHCH